MSTVFLHVGQCGNQLGQSFWDEASSKKWSISIDRHNTYRPAKDVTFGHKKCPPSAVTRSPDYVPWTRVDGSIPCVLVDTETKVIRRCLDCKHGSGLLTQRVPGDYCISDKTGRGNNWAFGYYGRKREAHGKEQDMLSRVLSSVRKAVERCNQFSGFIMFHSIAGGTGSGLGSALLEHLRADYPLSYFITVTIAPFSQGETPLQHLNSLLCLSWLQAYSDAVFLFPNDSVLEQTQKQLVRLEGGGVMTGGRVPEKRDREKDAVSVEDMNRYTSSVLCNALMPIWQPQQKLPNLAFQEPWELIRSLCPDPRTKFITSNHVSLTKPSNSWNQATTCILQDGSNSSWRKITKTKAQTSSLAFIVRSSPSNMNWFIQGFSALESKLKKAYNTVTWNPFPVDYWMSHEPSMGQLKMATVLANSSTVLNYVETVQEKASLMYREKAYLHWYERYGCEKETFKEAFEAVELITDNYKN